MPTEDDVERLGIEMLGRSGVHIASVTMYWSCVVVGLLGTFCERLPRDRSALVFEVFERWGMAMPFVMNEDAVPRVWMRSESAALRGYFEKTLEVIGHIETSGIPRQEGGAALREARDYCVQVIAEVHRLSALGDLTTEIKTFGNLAYHCKQLLCIVLGEAFAAEFAQQYDEAISVINATVRLVTAPTA